jgi:hypothetical protein
MGTGSKRGQQTAAQSSMSWALKLKTGPTVKVEPTGPDGTYLVDDFYKVYADLSVRRCQRLADLCNGELGDFVILADHFEDLDVHEAHYLASILLDVGTGHVRVRPYDNLKG